MAIGTASRSVDRASTPRRWRYRVRFALPFVIAIAAFWTLIDPAVEETVGPLAVILGNASAGILFIRGRKSLPRAEGRAFFLIGAAFLLASVGILVVGIIDEVTGAAKAFGPTDLFFIATYIAMVAGLASLPHTQGSPTQRMRVWLDGLIGAISLGTLLWVLLLADPLSGLSDAAPWERIAGPAYPILDVVSLIVVMIVAVRRGSLRFDPRVMFLGLGFAAQALADTAFLTSGIGKTFGEASPDFTLYLAASFCYVAAALLVARRPEEREYADRTAALFPMIAPYTAALAMVGVLFGRIVTSDVDTLTVDLLVATLVVGGLVVGRQAVAIRENRLIVERERAALVSSISHELRTPLTAMMGFLDILSEDESDVEEEERGELTGIVHQQAVYMSRIVADLIMLARGKASDISLSEGPVSVRRVIDSAITTVSDASGATDVSCAAGLVVYADGDRLQQVLVNLLANAVRYGGDYRAIVARVERENVVIEVHDNGHGVPPRYALSIWERFERGPNRYNASKPGSGIGLAVVEAVAKAHGGSASYERSALLGGACFRVRLPADRMVPPAVPESVVTLTRERSA